MLESQKLTVLAERVQVYLERSHCGHDFYHAKRVAAITKDLIKYSPTPVNQLVILAAAFSHDLCRPFEKQTGKSHFGQEALAIIDRELELSNFDSGEREQILEVIRYHDIYDYNLIPQLSPELKIHQDADRLDAIGAIGIARTFAFGAANGLPLYIPGQSLEFSDAFVESPEHRTSTIAHFYEKLLKLKEQMHTERGRELATTRHKLMEDFLEQFFKEWELS
jgi:uncharacterized protein